ncbi:MAG: RrF2 family transcriptional regulator [Limisphaerales bacterium]
MPGILDEPKFRHVKLSVKSDYAARAVLWLARHYNEGGARKVEEMGTEQGIPPKYLVQILIELKSKQIVKSVRGKEGGYLLAKAPTEISLGDVIRCVEGEILDTPALTDPKCPPELRDSWRNIQKAVNESADSITFQQLMEAGAEKEKMYYI